MPRQQELIRQRVHQYRTAVETELGNFAGAAPLVEAFNRVVDDLIRMDNEGWQGLNQISELTKGFTLEDIKKTTQYLEQNVKTNNLLGRGLRLRNNHAFGRGFTIDAIKEGDKPGKIAPRYQAIIDDAENQEIVFSPMAMKELNRILYTAGNIILTYDVETRKFERWAIDVNVENVLTYTNNKSRIKYYLLTWDDQDDLRPNAEPKVKQLWVPVSTYKDGLSKGALPKRIGSTGNDIEVSQTKVVIDHRANKDNGETWGVPDAFDASPWAWAANNSYKNGVKIWDAQTTISMVVTASTVAAQKSAGAKVQRDRVGKAAITGPSTEIKELPKNNMIDLYGLRPLVAQVALALDVSVSALSADVGKGGARAAEQTLEGPELLAALARQEEFSEFIGKCFKAMGLTNAKLNWKRLDSDPLHRVAQTAAFFRDKGGINQQEYRDLGLEILDITPTTNELPKPDEFTGAKTTDPDAANDITGDRGELGDLNDPNSARDGDL